MSRCQVDVVVEVSVVENDSVVVVVVENTSVFVIDVVKVEGCPTVTVAMSRKAR
jgi:hypothetical protein